MEAPLVSCVVAIYNLVDCVERCVDSLLNQDYENLQIILVDDGSTDDSLAVCRKISSAHENIKVLNKQNGGQSSARNYAVARIDEGLVVFVDIDDVVAPDFVSTLVAANGRGQKDISVVGLYQTGNPVEWLENYKVGARDVLTLGSDEAVRRLLAANGINESPCGKLAPVDIWKKVPFPEGRVYEDLSVMARVLGGAERINVVDAKLYGQVYRKGSTTRKKINKKQFLDFALAIRDVNDYAVARFGDSISELMAFRALMCARLLRLENDLSEKCSDCESILNKAANYLREIEMTILFARSIDFSLKAKVFLILHFPKAYQALYLLGERKKMKA